MSFEFCMEKERESRKRALRCKLCRSRCGMASNGGEMRARKGEHFFRGGREVEKDEEFGVVGGFMADDGDWASPGLTDTGGD